MEHGGLQDSQPTKMSLRPIFKSVGGKYYMAEKLQRHMPLKFSSMCENFARGFSLTLSLPKTGRLEVWNDLDPELFALTKMVKENVGIFTAFLKGLVYDQNTFEKYKASKTPGPLSTYVKLNMSRGGLGQDFSWSKRFRGGTYAEENSWNTRILELPKISDRLKDVVLMNVDGIELLESYANDPLTFQYLDPPYLEETRTAKGVYGRFEMTFSEHVRMLMAAKQCKGPVMISGYDCDEYKNALKDWNQVTFDMPNHAGQGNIKQRRVESIWKNY